MPNLEEGKERSVALEIDNVERSLRDELADFELVGEIDLDVWGPVAEKALLTRVARCDPERLRRLWPATLATYLVYQGIHAYELSTFWPKISIPELRSGGEVGPQFELALDALNLPVFEDLEELEGFDKHTRGRFVRRIHLHGGLPRDSVASVLGLLASTLRSGAASAAEVVDQWSSLDLHEHLHNKAAERFLVYTGDFALRIVDQLITLVRATNQGRALQVDGLPSHLVDGVIAYAERRREPSSWVFAAGPRVKIDPHLGGPFLVVPVAANLEWAVNGTRLGMSSRQVERQFMLPRPITAWDVSSDDGKGETHRRFVSASSSEFALVFDERGRLHRRGTTFGGLTAYVLAPLGTAATGVNNRRTVGQSWNGFELLTCDLRGHDELVVRQPGSTLLSLTVDNALEVHLGRGEVAGVHTADGESVVSGTVTLAFNGYLPNPAEIEVATRYSSLRLSEALQIDGEFDITSCFDPTRAKSYSIVVHRQGIEPVTIAATYLPNLRLERPRLCEPGSERVVGMHLEENDTPISVDITFAPFEREMPVGLLLIGGPLTLRVALNRLEWAIDGPHTLIPVTGGEGFSIRLAELRDHTLRLRTGGVSVRVAVLGAHATHKEWARQDRHNPEIRTFEIKSFAETARASSLARCQVAVLCDDDPPLVIGSIESRYEPTSMAVESVIEDEHTIVEVSWTELAEWPGRVVRLWDPRSEVPIKTVPVTSGETSMMIDFDEPPPGRYMIEVAATNSWGQPKRPTVGPGCCSIYLGSPEVIRLRQAVAAGDRRARFDDDDLDDLTPLLADLVLEQATELATRDQRLALLERVADDQWRAIDVITETHDRIGENQVGDGYYLIEPYLFELLPMLWVNPVYRIDNSVTHLHLEHLWEIAPLAAACLDNARDDEGCKERWFRATGVTIEHSSNVVRSLDKLAARIPCEVDGRWEPVELLGRDAWSQALYELARVDQKSRAWQALCQHRDLARDIERYGTKSGRVRWTGVPIRVNKSVKPGGKTDEWMVELVRLSCELLEPGLPDCEPQVLGALRAGYKVSPTAVRCTLLFAAASLRILEDVGDAARLLR